MVMMLDKIRSTEESRIRQARKAAGLTMEQLAVKAGICLSTLREAERGWYSATTLNKIAAVLGVSPESLYQGGTG